MRNGGELRAREDTRPFLCLKTSDRRRSGVALAEAAVGAEGQQTKGGEGGVG